jgi:hypothetical protein
MTAAEPIPQRLGDGSEYGRLARRVAEAVAARFPQATGEVTEVAGSEAYADIGARDGIRSDARVGIYRIEPPVIDSETGEMLRGRHLSIVAHGRVTEVQEASSRVALIDGAQEQPATLERGMIVHVL